MQKPVLIATALLLLAAGVRPETDALPGTQPLLQTGDLAAQMVQGIDKYLMREVEKSAAQRPARWSRDTSSPERYLESIKPNRERFSKFLGLVDPRDPVSLRWTAEVEAQDLLSAGAREPIKASIVAKTEKYTVYAVAWNVFRNVRGEGLLLLPGSKPVANIIALPDCDWAPEKLVGISPGLGPKAQFARRLAENGCAVLVPVLIDRRDTYSGIPSIRMTNLPHREYLWRAAYQMGRTMIGYEVQKVLAAVDWFKKGINHQLPLGVIGYGEGGLLAFYSTAVDPRIDAAAVSGYFEPREHLWREPIYRNVWSLLTEFGDAEIATLIAPRTLVIEASRSPEVDGPPQTPKVGLAAPGTIRTPPFDAVQREVDRARQLVPNFHYIHLVANEQGPVVNAETLENFLTGLGVRRKLNGSGPPPKAIATVDEEQRHKRLFVELLEDTQHLMRESEFARQEFWARADPTSVDSWEKSTEWYRQYFWDEIIGRLPEPTLPPNARTRLIYDRPRYRGYEVVLDVYPDVYAYGILLLPKGIQPGERRPVVVCQHGLEGRPQDVADADVDHRAYHRYAARLAERGFITYSPQNPYIGEDKFRILLRKGQPLKMTLFSFIVRQHERTLEWLAQQPFVDSERIAFYGLSYGGKTAMRVPLLFRRYCLSICSADYNEWIWKNVSARHRYSYLLTREYEMPEFNLGNTFNYAEMSWLIFPRPFMVERGHHDGVAPDEWVAYEYAKTKRHYDLLGLGDRTELEVFDGPHTIHGVGTFKFLHRHLKWPEK